MIECKAGHFSIYFEGGFPGHLLVVYNGVVVNARDRSISIVS